MRKAIRSGRNPATTPKRGVPSTDDVTHCDQG
ncbi:hypothetical protein CCYS_03795 [Corynebacterium cystitidis DSM 20524]|nr:hypothetical protein CCYS_03795 [Corynebacterium cystitidis DSM 20524]SNV84465.1 Uncharacterised protein [Corynebacterium cystitidis]